MNEKLIQNIVSGRQRARFLARVDTRCRGSSVALSSSVGLCDKSLFSTIKSMNIYKGFSITTWSVLAGRHYFNAKRGAEILNSQRPYKTEALAIQAAKRAISQLPN